MGGGVVSDVTALRTDTATVVGRHGVAQEERGWSRVGSCSRREDACVRSMDMSGNAWRFHRHLAARVS